MGFSLNREAVVGSSLISAWGLFGCQSRRRGSILLFAGVDSSVNRPVRRRKMIVGRGVKGGDGHGDDVKCEGARHEMCGLFLSFGVAASVVANGPGWELGTQEFFRAIAA